MSERRLHVQETQLQHKHHHPPAGQDRGNVNGHADHDHDGHDRDAHGHSHGLVHESIKRSRAGVRAVLISLGVLGLAAAAQTVIFVLSGSVALLADQFTTSATR